MFFSRRKSFYPLHTRNEKKERKGKWRSTQETHMFICIVKGREKEQNREKERDRGMKETFSSETRQERAGGRRRELWGYFIVKMKAPPLIAAPLVRGRRNRPIDSRIYRKGSMIQPGLPTTTLATADDSWCSWPESLLRIRRSSFRRLIASLLVWRGTRGFRKTIHWNCFSIVKASSTLTDSYFDSVNLIL